MSPVTRAYRFVHRLVCDAGPPSANGGGRRCDPSTFAPPGLTSTVVSWRPADFIHYRRLLTYLTSVVIRDRAASASFTSLTLGCLLTNKSIAFYSSSLECDIASSRLIRPHFPLIHASTCMLLSSFSTRVLLVVLRYHARPRTTTGRASTPDEAASRGSREPLDERGRPSWRLPPVADFIFVTTPARASIRCSSRGVGAANLNFGGGNEIENITTNLLL